MITPPQSEKVNFKSDRHDGAPDRESRRPGEDRAEAAIRSGAEEIRHGAHEAVEGGKEVYEGLKDMAGEGYDAAKQATCDATDSLRSLVTRNPIASLSIAAGIGMVLGGMLLTRLRS